MLQICRYNLIDYESGNIELSFILHCLSKCQSVPLQFSLCQHAREETMRGFVGRKEKRKSMKIIYVYLVYMLHIRIRA
jgi:hypothetical protein